MAQHRSSLTAPGQWSHMTEPALCQEGGRYLKPAPKRRGRGARGGRPASGAGLTVSVPPGPWTNRSGWWPEGVPRGWKSPSMLIMASARLEDDLRKPGAWLTAGVWAPWPVLGGVVSDWQP